MNKNHSTPPEIDCAEFQEHMPELFASGGDLTDPALQHHLDTCDNCAALVRDLEYIAEQARQLLEPTIDPSDQVWANIQSKLKEESGV